MPPVRVLIVEDEAIIALSLQRKLQSMGYAVTGIVATGDQAIEAAGEGHADLVLMDIMLRGDMDGIAAANRIRDALRIPVIYLTASTDLATVARMNLTEPFGYLHKPVNEQELRITMEMGLHAHRLREQLRQSEAGLQRALTEMGRREIGTHALLDAARAVLTCHTFEDAARRIFDACREATGAVSGYVALMNDNGTENDLLFLEAGGLPCHVDPSLPMPIRGLRAEAYARNEVVYDNAFMDSAWVAFMPAGHCVLSNVLFAPLILNGAAVGVLGLANKAADFTEDDARIAGAFGDLAAVALHRMRTEGALRQSEQMLRQMAEAIQDVFWMTEPVSARVLYVSPRYAEIWQRSPEELYRDSSAWLAAIHPDDVETVLANWQKQLNGISTLEQFRITRPDGSVRWIENAGYPISTDAGGVHRVAGIAKDITDRKRDADLLRESEARYRQLAQENERLVQEVNHRVGNNLAMLSGLIEWSAADAQAPETQDVLLDLQGRLQSMAEVHRLLSGSQWERVDLVEMLESVVCGVLSAVSSRDRIVYRLEPAAEPVLVPAKQAFRLALVLNELVTNSIKYAFTNGNHGELRCRTVVEGPWVTLTFSDDGPGWPPEVLAGERTGMGLSLIYASFKDEMQGSVSLSNDEGAVVRLRFSRA